MIRLCYRSILFLTAFQFICACSKKDSGESESVDFAKQIQSVQVARTGANNDFDVSVSYLKDEAVESLSFLSSFVTEKKNYVLEETNDKPYKLRVQCITPDDLYCENAVIKIEGLDGSDLSGVVTLEQFVIDNAKVDEALLAGDYDSEIFAPIIRDLAKEIKEARDNNIQLENRLVLRRLKSINKHFFNFSIFKQDVSSVEVFQFRGYQDAQTLTMYNYLVRTDGVDNNRRNQLQNTFGSSSEIKRRQTDSGYTYDFLLRFVDTPTGHISPILNMNIQGQTGIFLPDEGNKTPDPPHFFDF